MSKKRINIDGEWYVKEKDTIPKEALDVIDTLNCCYEDARYIFRAIKIFKTNEVLYEGLDIEFTDKRDIPFKINYIDNTEWVKSLYNNDTDTIEDALKLMCEDGIHVFQEFIGLLIEKKWL